MAIKFEDVKGGKPVRKDPDPKAQPNLRSTTPLVGEKPIGPEAAAELPFAKPPLAEKKGRRPKP